MNICEECNKSFSTDQSLKRHKTTCPVIRRKTIDSMREETARLIKTEEELRKKILILEQKLVDAEFKHQEELADIKRRHHEEIMDEKYKYREELLEITAKRAAKYEDHLIKESSKPKHVTNNTNIVYAPFTLTTESAETIAQTYTEEEFLGGPNKTIEFIFKNFLYSPSGDPIFSCSDLTRGIIRARFEDGRPFIDVGGKMLAKRIERPITKSIFQKYRNLTNKYPERDEELSLLDKKQRKSIAGPRLPKELVTRIYSDTKPVLEITQR